LNNVGKIMNVNNRKSDNNKKGKKTFFTCVVALISHSKVHGKPARFSHYTEAYIFRGCKVAALFELYRNATVDKSAKQKARTTELSQN